MQQTAYVALDSRRGVRLYYSQFLYERAYLNINHHFRRTIFKRVSIRAGLVSYNCTHVTLCLSICIQPENDKNAKRKTKHLHARDNHCRSFRSAAISHPITPHPHMIGQYYLQHVWSATLYSPSRLPDLHFWCLLGRGK